MSIDPRIIADKTGVPKEDVRAVLAALSEVGDGEHYDHAAVEKRSPEEIMRELERFLNERNTSEKPVFDPSATKSDVYAREHVENLKQVTTDCE
jgi:hypothetical protein